jgi:hypothetical protein
MSIRALLKGVEKRLRSEDVLNDRPDEAVGALVGIHDDGKPPPNCGQFYWALWWTGGRGTDKNPTRHDVMHGVCLTLTARLNYAPRDRQGERLTGVGDVYDLVDELVAPDVVHGNWDVIQNANEFIEGTAAWAALDSENREVSVNGFIEPLVLGTFAKRPTPAGWLGSEKGGDIVVVDVRFEMARRIQVNYG